MCLLSVDSLYKRDARAIFLYVQDISDDDYHIFFSSDVQAQRSGELLNAQKFSWFTFVLIFIALCLGLFCLVSQHLMSSLQSRLAATGLLLTQHFALMTACRSNTLSIS